MKLYMIKVIIMMNKKVNGNNYSAADTINY